MELAAVGVACVGIVLLSVGLGPLGPIAGGAFAASQGAGIAAGSAAAFAQSAAMGGAAAGGTLFGTGAALGSTIATAVACVHT